MAMLNNQRVILNTCHSWMDDIFIIFQLMIYRYLQYLLKVGWIPRFYSTWSGKERTGLHQRTLSVCIQPSRVPKSTGLDIKKIVKGCGWGVKGVEYGWNMSHSHSRDKTWRVESTIKHRSQLGSWSLSSVVLGVYGKAMAKMATTSYLHTAMLSVPVVRSRRSTSHCSPSCFSCWFERSWLERP